MNKISALEAYKVSIIIEDVTNHYYLNLISEFKQIIFPWSLKIKYGRRDDRNDVSRDNKSHGLAEQTWERIRKTRYT
jgi:hypothetical protein